jgi:hypothetical protein
MFEIVSLFTVLCPPVLRVEDLRDSTAHAEIICIREASNKLKTCWLAVLLHTHSFMFFRLDCVDALQKKKNSVMGQSTRGYGPVCYNRVGYSSVATVPVTRVRVPNLYIKRGYVIVKVRKEQNRSTIIYLFLPVWVQSYLSKVYAN